MASLFLAAALSAAGLTAQVLDLPPVPQDPAPGVRFHLSLDGGRSLVWGRGADIPRWFSREDLPALFSRTLWLDGPPPAGSSIDWIFTGDAGGFTVRILPGRVRLSQRYYDSYGLSATRPPKTRYPDKTWEETEVAYTGSLGSVTVALDHKLGLLLSLNGKQAARQTCLLEARRHQLAWTPPKGATSGGVAGRITAPEPVAVRVRVDSARRHQTIYGFGGIMSFPAYARLSPEGRRKWWGLIQEYNLLIHREYPNGSRLKPDFSNFDQLEDATPHYYGDNFPNGEISDFTYSRRIQNLGGKVLFEYWQLPPWALREGKPIVSEYVRAMLAYCRAAKQKTGRAPEVLGIQNEIVQPAETWRDMILELRKALDREGFQAVRLHLPDNSTLKGGIATLRAVQQSPEAWKAIDYAATHVYDFQRFFEDPDGYDALVREWKDLAGAKPFLSTEFTVNNAAYQSSSYRTAFAQAQLYHKNMAMMDASALIYCWTLLDIEQPSFGATRSLFVLDRSRGWTPAASSYQARVFGAFSRRLREGMVRVDAVSDRADLLVTAYEGKAGAKTAIAINRSTAPLRLSLDWAGPAITTAEIASSYEANAPRRGVKLPITVQPGEIVTLTNVPLRRPVIVP